jgi:hypothetical protein
MHPEAYLNHTQLKTWETSPNSYRKIFIQGKPIGTNRGMALGKEIADSLELDIETGDPMKDLVLAQIPKFEIRDKFLYMDLEHDGIKIPLRIRPDTVKADYSAFKEYKTGPKHTWHQKKVDTDSQITFYATGLYILSGKIPQDIELVHAITEYDEHGRPHLTGEIVRYQTRRTLMDVIKMKVRIKRCWKEISLMLESELL